MWLRGLRNFGIGSFDQPKQLISQRATSIPSIRSVCCPLHPPGIRIGPRPCSAETIAEG